MEYLKLIIPFIIGSIFSLYVYKLISNFKLSRSRKKGEKGEVVAKKWLVKHGYEILDEQLTHDSFWEVNFDKKSFSVRPDFLVKKDDEITVVEVKTGKAASLQNSKTRRQIREYNSLFPMYEIALFDATQKIFYYIDFGNEKTYEESKKSSFRIVIFAFIFGIIITMVILKFVLRVL